MKPDTSATASAARGLDRASLVVFLFCLATPLAYALFTGHVWEDFLIAFRHATNLVAGDGLVYTPGERVQGFSSPLGVLLPALFHWITGASASYEPALWCYRVVGMLSLASAATIVFRMLRRDGEAPGYVAALFVAYLALDAKAVAFSVNGMETALMLLFLAPSVGFAVSGCSERWRTAGACWAGLMWTRPDGAVFIAALALVGLAFARARHSEWAGLGKAALVCTVLYLPWFSWSWIYYGSPVPHSLVAKAASLGHGFDPLQRIESVAVAFPDAVRSTFEPIYAVFGGWPSWVAGYGWVCGIFCAVYWLLPTGDRTGRIASALFSLFCLYLAYVGSVRSISPWYLPPAGLCGAIVLSRGPLRLAGARPHLRRAALSFNVAVLLAAGALISMTAVQMRIQQQEIELGVRREVGRWLAGEMGADDRVYLEPLGYIGFFSGHRVLDYPGLVSPEVVRARKANPRLDMYTLIPQLRPEWVVLRPWETAQAARIEAVRRDYQRVKVFDATERLERHGDVPGKRYLEIDAAFWILKRKTPAGTEPVAR